MIIKYFFIFDKLLCYRTYCFSKFVIFFFKSRAETSFAIALSSNYKKKENEMRALTKALIKAKANIIPDYKNKTLTVELFSLSNPRENLAAKNICEILNETQTIFPTTDLMLKYKIATF